jgi:hypothetical protein
MAQVHTAKNRNRSRKIISKTRCRRPPLARRNVHGFLTTKQSQSCKTGGLKMLFHQDKQGILIS